MDDLVEGVTMLMQADPARHPEPVEGRLLRFWHRKTRSKSSFDKPSA
jgi:hypothetical protein